MVKYKGKEHILFNKLMKLYVAFYCDVFLPAYRYHADPWPRTNPKIAALNPEARHAIEIAEKSHGKPSREEILGALKKEVNDLRVDHCCFDHPRVR